MFTEIKVHFSIYSTIIPLFPNLKEGRFIMKPKKLSFKAAFASAHTQYLDVQRIMFTYNSLLDKI